MKGVFLVFNIAILISSTLFAVNEVDSLSGKMHVVSKIQIVGNKTTKPWVIERELDFKIGDSLSRFELNNAIATSKINLTNTALFNFIDVKFIMIDEVKTEIFIMLTERWYLWPIPVFELAETNFNSWWENKDFSRINYGINFTKYNFRGRDETLKILLQFGFTELVRISYSTPYLNKNKTIGLGVYGGYGQNHEVNYLSSNNRRLFYKDVSTIQLNHIKSGFEIKYRRKFYSNHGFGLSFTQVGISDSVVSLNPDYLLNGNKESQYLSLNYRFTLDKRDNKNYALEGIYARVIFSKLGLGILESDIDLWWSSLYLKKYFKLGSRTYLAGSAKFNFYLNDLQPYYLRDGLGYSDKNTVRSYELYVIDAQQLAIGKMQLRYQLVAPKKYNMGFMPVNKFKKIHYSVYLGLFGDIGYGNDQYSYPSNDFSNEIQYGSGISVDFATYYDLVFRLEYSINKFAEHGLFLHFVAPI